MKLVDKKELLKNPPKSEFDLVRDVMPDEIVVGIEGSPEDMIEREGMEVSKHILHASANLTHDAAEINNLIEENVELLGEEDIKTLKEVSGELKALSIKVQALATTYDEAEISNSARKALKKLLK